MRREVLLGLAHRGQAAETDAVEGDVRWAWFSVIDDHDDFPVAPSCNVSRLPTNAVSLRGAAAKRVTTVSLEGHCEICAP
ncbi:MAG: hypothetical protein ACHREM_25675 [Polyangiales bacterium]